jgi:hypothetical protein
MKSPLSFIVALMCGLIVLAGYFFSNSTLLTVRATMLEWAVTVAGVAGLVAIFHLIFGVHVKRLHEAGPKRFYSIVVILAFLAALVAGLFFGPADSGYQKIVTAIQVPIETSLMAVLAVTLSYASLRLLKRQRNWMGVVFFLSVIVYLVLNSGVLAFSADIPVLQQVLSGFHQIPVAGARGILLGIALGSLLTGIRILIGSDQPYSE